MDVPNILRIKMRCPKCNLENPSSVQRCDCGYDFISGTMKESYLRKQTPKLSPAERIAHTQKSNVLVRRWAATMVDLAVLFIITIFPVLIIKLAFSSADADQYFFDKSYFGLAMAIWATIVILFYYIFLEGRYGWTLGKLAAKIRVVSANGDSPGFKKAFLRTILRLLEVNPLLFGAIPAGIAVIASKNHQRLGDMAASTFVLHASDACSLKSDLPAPDGHCNFSRTP
jgi:uncharacterized RDD family membrane protein YckC